MLYTVENQVAIFSLILLLAISIVTVEICRRDRLRQQTSAADFWLSGKTKAYSLASNLGALASVTYFFGGGLTYGFVFGPWYLVASGAVFLLSGIFIVRMLPAIQKEAEAEGQTSNPLIAYMRRHLEARDLKVVLRLYTVVYSTLLVVELAAGRLALSSMLPASPVLVTIFISVIAIVIFTYLYLGGFKAVLNSDLIQLTILIPFLGCLSFLLLKEDEARSLMQIPLTAFSRPDAASFLFLVITCVAYFVAGFDFFSRLNFTTRKDKLAQRKSFIAISLCIIFLMMTVGILYGMHLKSYRTEVGSATEFAHFATAHFVNRDQLMIPLLFVVCIFCMIFTTVDTLLLTVFQLGFEMKSKLLLRKNVGPILSAALVASTFVGLDFVSVVAVFALSLMILPLVAVWKAFAGPRARCLPSNLQFLEGALLLSVALFILFYSDFRVIYESHFLIMGLVVLSTLVAASFAGLRDLLRRKRT